MPLLRVKLVIAELSRRFVRRCGASIVLIFDVQTRNVYERFVIRGKRFFAALNESEKSLGVYVAVGFALVYYAVVYRKNEPLLSRHDDFNARGCTVQFNARLFYALRTAVILFDAVINPVGILLKIQKSSAVRNFAFQFRRSENKTEFVTRNYFRNFDGKSDDEIFFKFFTVRD